MSSVPSKPERGWEKSPLAGFLIAGWIAGAAEGAFVAATERRAEVVAFSAALASLPFLIAGLAAWGLASVAPRLPGVASARALLERFTTSDPEADRAPVILAHGFGVGVVLFGAMALITAMLVMPPLFRLQVEEVGIGFALGLVVTLAVGAPIAAALCAKLLYGPLSRLDQRYRLPLPRPTWARWLLFVTLPLCVPNYHFLWRFGSMLGLVRDGILAALLVGAVVLTALLLSVAPPVARRRATLAALCATLAMLVGASVLHGRREKQALAAERAMLSSLGGRIGRWLTDVDRDGSSSLFGGGDCAAFDRSRAPGIGEIYGNGQDENCDGKDAVAELAITEGLKRFSDVLTPQQVRPYNVVWVLYETTRGDRASPCGYPRPTMPALDALADDSLLFCKAFAHASSTIQSIPTQLAGRDPAAVTWFRERSHFQMASSETMLAERLGRAGYKTGAVVDAYLTRSVPHILQGFEKRYDAEPDKQQKNNRPRRNPISTAKAAEFLATIGANDKFFLLVYYPDSHAPYTRHPDVDSSPFERNELGNYDTELLWADQQLGALVGILKARDAIWKNTILVVSADHGEEFNEHGSVQHGRTCHTESVHVPLLVRVPGISKRRIDIPVGLVDIVPTVLELTGVRGDAEVLSGQSLLVPALAPKDADPNRPIFCSIASITDKYGTYFRRSVRQGHLVLMQDVNEGRYALFNTEDDPGEHRDVLEDPAYAAQLQQMKAMLTSSLTGNLRDHTKW